MSLEQQIRFCVPFNSIPEDMFNSKEREALQLVAFHDQARIEWAGGYPSVAGILGSEIIIATIDHRGAPDFQIWDIEESARDAEEWRDELEEPAE